MEKQKEENVSEPKVTMFGEEIRDDDSGCACSRHKRRGRRCDCHSSSSDPFGGILFIFVGIILFLNMMNIIPFDFWNQVLKFWPIILIMIGLKFILGNSIISNLMIFILSIIVFSFIALYGLMGIGSPLVGYFPQDMVNYINNLNHFNK
ncbi:MAG: DUF5668 domain-containing protein [Candidatus Pacebacteria bacterium]|nr:DUF5668 domain-containing protein [Candidatus Paceibacterota bacterium]